MCGSRSDIEFLFNAAVGFHKAGNLQRASELYERVQTIEPRHVMSLNNQAMIAKALGRLDLSLQMLKEAFLKEPDNFEVLANLGRVSMQNREFADAEKYLQEALDIKPQDINLEISLGKALFQQGKNREAKNVLLKILDREKQNFDVLFTLGLIAEELNDKHARHYFECAEKMQPDDNRVVERLSKMKFSV